jgi:hypothetical protein
MLIEVNEMIVETTMVEGKYFYSGFVSRILVLVGFIPKVLVRSGCKDPGAIDKLGGRVLGHNLEAGDRPDHIQARGQPPREGVQHHDWPQLDQGDPAHLGH